MRSRLLSAAVLLGVSLGLCGVTGSAWGAGDATEAFCPNEGLPGFVASLPDCRAYEMVSPAFKDGGESGLLAAMSSDGSRVLANGLFGVFAGAEDDSGPTGAFYMFARTAAGWEVSPVTPPGSLFAYSEFAAASSDLSRVLFGVRSASQSWYAEDLYVREPDGSFVEVGPKFPPSLVGGPPAGSYTVRGAFTEGGMYAGASADLSHVLFQIHPIETFRVGVAPYWPGDTTGSEQSVGDLYEYVGRGNTRPSLVGLNGQGRLIGDCGTALGASTGSRSGDVYNAVSSDGGTVFFTALGEGDCAPAFLQAGAVAPAVNELWARIGGIESVPISEPSSSQCEACDAGAVQEPAVFQGASEDGSKVFFLTEQELLAGDRGMNLYEYDFDNPLGKKIVRVSIGSEEPEVQGVVRVSEDGTHVYFVAKGVLSGANAEGSEPVPGGENLYVFERDAVYPAGRVAFVATLSPADVYDWVADDEERPVQVTSDGRFVVFQSVADLTPGDTSSEPQVFEYDALAERLVRVSIGQTGYASGLANANAHGSEIPRQDYSSTVGFQPAQAATHLAVSAVVEGGQVVSRVVFSSKGALTPGAEVAARAGASSVYEYRSVGSIANGSVYLISDGTNKQNAEADGLDASGADVFFGTADPLLAQDVDTNYDLYDARSGGGFPAPAAPAGCEGEDCQGSPSVGPSFGVAGSVGAVAGGNLPPLAAPGPVAPSPKPKPKKPKAKLKHHAIKRKKKRGRSVNSRGLVVDVKGRG
jgi:hypothetical protein